MQENEEFETHDIYLAAYLLCAGCKMDGRRRQGARMYFKFTNPAGSLVQLREEYYAGTATVKAQEFTTKIMGMKNLCFQDLS